MSLGLSLFHSDNLTSLSSIDFSIKSANIWYAGVIPLLGHRALLNPFASRSADKRLTEHCESRIAAHNGSGGLKYPEQKYKEPDFVSWDTVWQIMSCSQFIFAQPAWTWGQNIVSASEISDELVKVKTKFLRKKSWRFNHTSGQPKYFF